MHPNGVCLTGRWSIDQETPYSGCFRKGTDAVIVGRYSTCCGETRRGRTRSLSLVGKLFPTGNPGHLEPLPTATFFTQADIGRRATQFVNGVELRNAPDRRRRGAAPASACSPVVGLPAGRCRAFDSSSIKSRNSASPAISRREAPQFMRLLIMKGSRDPGADLDFRDGSWPSCSTRAILPKRTLTFTIEVTDEGEPRARRSSSSGRLRTGDGSARSFASQQRLGDPL